MDLQRI
jgi:hypothetical protein